MSDPSLVFPDIEARLGVSGASYLEIRCVRVDPREVEQRVIEGVGAIAVELMFGGGDEGGGDEDPPGEPGIELAAHTQAAGRVVLGQLYPLEGSDARGLWLAASLRLAQRHQLGVRLDGERYDAATSQAFVPVGDRMRRSIEPQLFPGDVVHDPHATLVSLGWEPVVRGPQGLVGYRRAGATMGGKLRKFMRGLPFGAKLEAQTLGTAPAEHYLIEVGPAGIRYAEPGGSLISLALADVFAIGLRHAGWERRAASVTGLEVWTDRGPQTIPLPREVEPAQRRMMAVALEAWMWARLAELVAQWVAQQRR